MAAASCQKLAPVRHNRRIQHDHARTGGYRGRPECLDVQLGVPLQYSLPYYSANVAEIGNDFLKHLIPIAEFAFQTPIHNGAPPGQPQQELSSPALSI